jgi:hypothetical protein
MQYYIRRTYTYFLLKLIYVTLYEYANISEIFQPHTSTRIAEKQKACAEYTAQA